MRQPDTQGKSGEAITLVSEKDQNYFGRIESFLEYEVEKLPMPEGLEAGPEYNPKKKSSKGRSGGKKKSSKKSGRKSAKNPDEKGDSKQIKGPDEKGENGEKKVAQGGKPKRHKNHGGRHGHKPKSQPVPAPQE